MASTLLEKTRKLSKVLQNKGQEPVAFTELAELLKETLEANVYIVNNDAGIMGLSLNAEEDSPIVLDPESGSQSLPEGYGNSLAGLTETQANLTGKKLLALFKDETNTAHKYLTVLPIFGNSKRLGSTLLARANDKFDDADLVLAEFASAVVGMEMIRSEAQVQEVDARKMAVVEMAIGTLSYSEQEAVQHIFEELEGDEGILVASRIADRAGITRSVIVNALRKLESAGVIESRSLGMKGTRIKVLNDKLKLRLKQIR